MRRPSTSLAILLLAGWAPFAPGLADDAPPAEGRAEILRRHGLDPASPIDSRVKETQASVLAMFKEISPTVPTPHPLTDVERRKLSAAVAALPPLHRRVLSERLRSLSFLDGMPNTALTSPANPDEPYRLFDITIRAGIFREDVSDWMTQKERTCFEAGDAPPVVSVEAGTVDAIFYVLLHEATHVVDFGLALTPTDRPGEKQTATPSTPFTDGIWADRTTPAARFRDPLLEKNRYRAGGRAFAADQAEAVYTALRRTPFASLYGSSNWHDDLAEYLALYHLTEVLKQPYRIVVRRPGHEDSAYEPMKSDTVRGRVGQMKRFYEDRP